MTEDLPARPRMLLVGGGGGLVGRAVIEEFSPDWNIRSVHRHPTPGESLPSVEWIAEDAARVAAWGPLLDGVDVVLNVAWYRAGADRRFRPLTEGLLRLVAAARASSVRRLLQISVPLATPAIEAELPYMVRKREVDRAIASSGLPYSLVRPTMLFGPRDKLLTVMLTTMARWHRFPMFGDGEYHVSPLAARDLARILRREATLPGPRVVEAGGPRRWRYRDLTDRMFASVGLAPQYLRFSVAGGQRLARLLETVGSSLLYEYEVEWLVSDQLGLAPYEGLGTPLTEVDEFLRSEGRGRRPRAANG
jgi:uncharacterized protein YbjT (DUF2867 family)